MPLLNVVAVIFVVGVLLWLANRYAPMDATVKGILNAFVICALVLWILFACFPGTMHHIENIKIGN